MHTPQEVKRTSRLAHPGTTAKQEAEEVVERADGDVVGRELHLVTVPRFFAWLVIPQITIPLTAQWYLVSQKTLPLGSTR